MICYLSRNYRGVDNAGNKAKTDIEQIMESHGFRNVGLKQTRYRNVVVAFCRTLFSVLKSILCLRKGDVLVLQYPLKKYYAFVCNMAHLRGCKVVTLKRLFMRWYPHRKRISSYLSKWLPLSTLQVVTYSKPCKCL